MLDSLLLLERNPAAYASMAPPGFLHFAGYQAPP
jgi:hypothetical protein